MGDLSDFVSTTVLTSSDGFSFTEAAAVTTGSTRPAVNRDLAKLEGRTLYEQLQANKDKADEEKQARYKMNFGACRRRLPEHLVEMCN
jgi:F0F1-type ATP synthase alpha subunit